MNQPSPLIRLIWNFYRENETELQALQALSRCKISRAWGTVKIHCPDQDTLSQLLQTHELLNEPLAQLRIARRLRLWVKGGEATVFPILRSETIDWQHSFKQVSDN